MIIDPRTRIFSVAVLFILIISARQWPDLALLSLVVPALLIAGGGSLKTLAIRMTALAWLIVLVAYFGLVSPGPDSVGWAGTVAAVWRLGLLVALALGIASWLSPTDLADVVSSVNRRPNRITGLLGRFALTAGLAWRMLPEMIAETRRVYSVQRLRGLFAGRLSRINPAAWLLVLAPAVRRTMVRGRRTAHALAVRGFDPDAPRTSMIALRFGRTDLAAVLGLGVLTAVVTAL